MAFLQIPREIRQEILRLVICAPTESPKSPSASQDSRHRLSRDRFKGHGIWQLHPQNPALPLLLLNKQIHAEVKKLLRYIPTDYHADIMYLEDRGMWITWSIPVLPRTGYIESVNATLRIFDPANDLSRKFNQSLDFRGGDGGPPMAVWGFYTLLVRLLKSGPGYLQPENTGNSSSRFAVKSIIVNVLSPTDGAAHKSIAMSDVDAELRSGRRNPALRRDDPSVPIEKRLAEYMCRHLSSLLGLSYHTLNSGAIVVECIPLISWSTGNCISGLISTSGCRTSVNRIGVRRLLLLLSGNEDMPNGFPG